MKPVLLIIAILLFSPGTSEAQTSGYIIKGDTARSQGKITIEPSNPRLINFIASSKATGAFSADQVSEFGYKDGSKFFSKRILYKGEYQNVFLELLEEGQPSLFKLPSLKKSFFLEDDSVLNLGKDNYRNALRSYSGQCHLWPSQLRLVRYNKGSLSNFIREYNSNRCRNIPFPSYGPLIGYSFLKMFLSEDAYLFNTFGDYDISSTNVNFGFFLETPFWRANNLSLVSMVRFGNARLIKELLSASFNQDIKIQFSYLNLDITPKYSFDIKKHRPYLFLGGSFMYVLDSESEMLEANIEDQIVTLEKKSGFVNLPTYYYGLNLGLGFQFFYKYDHYIGLDFRNARSFSKEPVSLADNTFSIRVNL